MFNLFKKQKITEQPSPRELKIKALFKESVDGLKALQEDNKKKWDDGKRILAHLDLTNGTMNIHYADNRLVIANIEVIGTYDKKHRTFMWAYENPTIPKKLTSISKETAQWGVKNGLAAFKSNAIPGIPIDAAWDILAVATHLSNARGAETIDQGHVDVCVVLTSIESH